jgi:hypothetical protein
MINIDLCQDLLLTSLTEYYNSNPQNKQILKDIIEGKHKLSLRLIDWLVTHYAKTHNTFYWIHKNTEKIYEFYPEHINDSNECKQLKKINVYLDYRAQLKSYAKINFDSFRRHNRITFFLNIDTMDCIETTVGQLNFFRWAFSNNIIYFALHNYDKIYQDMIQNNLYMKQKQDKQQQANIQDITKTMCILRFD